jgi:hypothetical protein
MIKERKDDDDIQDYVRTWKGLTDEEIIQVLGNVREQLDGNVFGAFAKAIEAKLKEKNA